MGQFERFHPLVIFAYYIGAIALFIFIMHPFFLIAGLIIILGINFLMDRLIGLVRWLPFIITTGLLIIIVNPLFNQRGLHILFHVNRHRVTLEALIYGLMSSLLIICVMSLFITYNEVMTPNKLLYLFAKFLPQFAVLLMLTLRFIPLMKRRLTEISSIQMSKGISVVHGRWKEKLHNGMLFTQLLLVHSLEEAIQTADSMKARGYGNGSRSAYEYFRLQKKDLFALIYLVVLFIISLYGRFYGYGFLTVYPVMESLKLSPPEKMFLLSYLLYLSFPLLIELGGSIRWRLLNWKI